MKTLKSLLFAAAIFSLAGIGLAEPGLNPSSASRPRSRRVILNTEPTGATVRSYTGNVLGKSGQPIDFDTDEAGPTGQIELSLELEGHEPSTFILKFASLPPDNEHFPSKPIVLHSIRTPYWVVLPIVVPIVGLAGFAWLLKPRRGEELVSSKETLAGSGDHGSLAGIVLGRFRLVERVGAGGMATVYRAIPDDSNNSNQTVAVKIMRKELVEDREMLERFQRECKHTAELSHPNIVRMEDWGQQNDLFYLVLEWISGGDLRSRFDGPVAFEDVWDVLEPLCSAVQYAHNRGIVHRDLKPENIMVTQGGLLKVSDFGLARAGNADKVTATGAVLGTPAYMAPEQIEGQEPSPSMDQYAIGIIAYELLTGRLPFVEEDSIQLIFSTVSKTPPPPSSFRQMPKPIDDVVLKMLSKKPGNRFGNVQLAASALKEALLGSAAGIDRDA